MIRHTIGTAALVAISTALLAQEPAPAKAPSAQAPEPAPAAAGAKSARPRIPVRVQLVLSRYQGEKRITNLPYVLHLTANDPRKTSLRVGNEIPVSPGITYRPVGTNIDCTVEAVESGQYSLNVTISDSSVYLHKPEAAGNTAGEGGKADLPAFRSYSSTFNILLKDGQTTQYTSATDPITGEVMKIDVTLNVLK